MAYKRNINVLQRLHPAVVQRIEAYLEDLGNSVVDEVHLKEVHKVPNLRVAARIIINYELRGSIPLYHENLIDDYLLYLKTSSKRTS